MPNNKRIVWHAGLFILMFILPVRAQDKHWKKVKRWDPYDCCHDMSALQGRPAVITELHDVPEFFFVDTQYNGDTALAFACYDTRDSMLYIDTMRNFGGVKYASLWKRFTDNAHTYKGDHGNLLPLPVELIAQRYDRFGNKWMRITYPGGKMKMLKEFPHDIVRIDTFQERGVNPKDVVLSIYRYYKVAEQ